MMCTSPTQQSSSCIPQRNRPEKIGKHRRRVITDGTDMHSISGKYPSSVSSSESASTAKKASSKINKFKTSSIRRDVSSKSTTTKSFSGSESENPLKPKN